MFTIKAWGDEEEHQKAKKKDDGLYGTAQRVQDAIEAAKILSRSNDSVEVHNGDKLLYSISHDPKNPEKTITHDNRNDPTLIQSTVQEDEDETPEENMRFKI